MNILIVEDFPDWQDLFRDAFDESDVNFTVVDSIPEALDTINRGELFDLAIVDKGGSNGWSGEPDIFGHRDGLAVLELLTKEQPQCIRVLATAEPYTRSIFNTVDFDIFYDKRKADLADLSRIVAGWYTEGYCRREKPIILEGLPPKNGSRERLF